MQTVTPALLPSQALGASLRHRPVPAHVPRRDGCAGLGRLRYRAGDGRRLCGPIRVSAWRSSAASWRRKVFGSASSPSPTGTRAEPFRALGRPTLYFGVTGGNMDSMVNRYTADRRLRHNDSYSPGGEGGRRPDRCVIVYAQRCREAFRDVPIVLGGIEASLRRIAHYDYWSDKVRRSVLADAKADLPALRQCRARGGRRRPIGLAGGAKPKPISPATSAASRCSAACPTASPSFTPTISIQRRGGRPADARRDRRDPAALVRAGREPTGEAYARANRACCTGRAIPATRGRWCSAMATAISGSRRRRSR